MQDKKKVLVLGSSGMAGHVMSLHLLNTGKYEVTDISHHIKLRSETVLMDVSNFDLLGNYLDSGNFDFVVNCVGLLTHFAEENKDKAILLNGYLPHFLSKRIGEHGNVFHISTDCVFSGTTGGYSETSFRDGDTFYDRTKAIGELNNSKDLTFRTSIIGPDMNKGGIGLFNWFMNSTGEINGFSNAVWTGVTTIELAKAVEAGMATCITGLYHLVPKVSINKHALLCLFKDVMQRDDVSVVRTDNKRIDKSLVNTRNDFDFTVPGYNDMVVEMRNWITEHAHLYKHYCL
jgi:dTDP-4-dehydrorhamnose reductase